MPNNQSDLEEHVATIASVLFHREDQIQVTERSNIKQGNAEAILTAFLKTKYDDPATLTVSFWGNGTIKIVHLETPTSDPFVATCDDVLEAVAVIDSINQQ